MGLFSRAITAIVNHEAAQVESTDVFNQGIKEMFARGGSTPQPDRFQRDSAQYHAEVVQAAGAGQPVYAVVGGEVIDISSAEYANWYYSQGH
jgi:murein DD-endopeptidase MepM/ murein hydrolase activator NlpD